jgi:hypothetical protein
MSRSAFMHHIAMAERRAEHSLAWASAVTIVFAVVAAISLAVDFSVTLSNPPEAAASAAPAKGPFQHFFRP